VIKSAADSSAMVFALTGSLEVYKTKHPPMALVHSWEHGPAFQHALNMYDGKRKGICETKGIHDLGEYDVPADENGNSPLTGSRGSFLCEELEVFALE